MVPATERRCSICRAVYLGEERFCPRDGGAIATLDDRGDPMVGRTLGGRYFIRRPLGRGGMGAVYEAEHIGLDKRVAVKLILERFAADREAMQRFHREAKVASKIGHENIVDVTDIGDTEDGRSFIAMELLEGVDLGKLLEREGPLPPARAVAIVRQVLAGLAAAHSVGILHRDMKPENVFLSLRRDGREVVKIMDFGISKFVTARESNLRLTDTGTVVGTPIYMAPEQAMAAPDVDARADLYAVGVMLYELLAGRPPFVAPSYLALVTMHLSEPPPPLTASAPHVSPALAQVIHRALAKLPAERFASAEELSAALDAALRAAPGRAAPHAVAATLPAPALARTPLRSVAPPVARRPGWLGWALAGALLAAAGGAAWWLLPPGGPADGLEPSAAVTAPAATAAATAPTAVALPSTGILEIDSSPPGARVTVDGVARGVTPLRIEDLALGDHQFALEAPGFEPVVSRKAIRAGYVESVHVALARRGSGGRGQVKAAGRDRAGVVRLEPARAAGSDEVLDPEWSPAPAGRARENAAPPDVKPKASSPVAEPTDGPPESAPAKSGEGKPNPYVD